MVSWMYIDHNSLNIYTTCTRAFSSLVLWVSPSAPICKERNLLLQERPGVFCHLPYYRCNSIFQVQGIADATLSQHAVQCATKMFRIQSVVSRVTPNRFLSIGELLWQIHRAKPCYGLQGFPTELTPRVMPCCINKILEECAQYTCLYRHWKWGRGLTYQYSTKSIVTQWPFHGPTIRSSSPGIICLTPAVHHGLVPNM